MSKLRATLLYYLSKVDTSSGIPELSGAMGLPTTRKVGQNLWQQAKDGYAKKIKDSKPPHYAMTAKGRKYLKDNPHLIMTADELSEWQEGVTPSTGAGRYSSRAILAIDGISDLIHSNERMINTMRSVVSQLSTVLIEVQQNEDEENENG